MAGLDRLVASDTISAIATARGIGGVGIIRVSGSNLVDFAQQLTGILPQPRIAQLVSFLAEDGQPIDQGILLYFPAPHSYTGEDVLELQAHGGLVILNMLLSRTVALGARPAEPGEFTKRAFLNGKMDLVQAESIIDLIHAPTQTAARAASQSLSGVFSNRIRELSDQLITLRTFVEGAIDFSDEEIEFADIETIQKGLEQLSVSITILIDSAKKGAILREGIRIALIGRPNAGKSSLLNRLLGEDRAIVSDIPGTTRDTLSESLSLEGIPVVLVDTAGLRETDHPLEQLGIERSWVEIEKADVLLWIIDAVENFHAEDSVFKEKIPVDLDVLYIFNKIDLKSISPSINEDTWGKTIYCSAKLDQGIDLIKQEILNIIGWQVDSETLFVARERHLFALKAVKGALDRAYASLDTFECLAEELRLAHHTLETITGEFTPDDLLGEIFSRFCIGK